MAFKFTVDYQQLKLVIQTDSTEAVSLFEHLKTTVQYIDMQQIVAFQQLTAANVTIDADTLNRYNCFFHLFYISIYSVNRTSKTIDSSRHLWFYLTRIIGT